ncbi:hypothetical protein PHYSODRAFT_494041 [Phytophthora sojae]|uniref:Uncharacterized protein n=1 Tax=Phytophthora sojae (strain P6497) TaxID=1094619 RepID=G4ZB06_PHYSP|nr:hypothetical protein PHYSODRAFT_494041 [Phytophthora sojae]EGZ21225.1 hypothetical protein PHYSODRAFT_494041 [Phytophthora sojae]|eukprot:XP_009523942.1 hypothetical protein PHYSODRAFT_494041 [Phytophthora sojae]
MSSCDKVSSSTKPDTESRVRQVDVVRVPKPPSQGKSRSTPKQLRQTTISLKADRLAVHKYPTELAVTLDQFLIWARNTSNLMRVMEMLSKYPVQLENAYLRARKIDCHWEIVRLADYMHTFVIPQDLALSMQAATTTTRKEKQPIVLDEIISKFTSSRLRTEFVTLSNKVLISFDNIVGGICRGWLNDSPVDFCLETLARSVGKCHCCHH